jgi:HD-GYP domain-containing protein (c-di-GMP phosphodiesterase class II)
VTQATDPLPRIDLAELGEIAQNPSVERALTAVRELLGMEVSYTARLRAADQVLEVVSGDTASFGGVGPGAALPHEFTYCSRMLAGRIPNIVADARADERTASMPITQAANVGAIATVPVRFSDGRVWGTLCAVSHEAHGELGYRELQFLHVFARLVADQIERDEREEAARALELQAATAQTLIAAVEARDSYTGEHSRGVVEHATAVGRRLGLDADALTDAEHVALLHDIGKISIPDSILQKPGRLTDEEWDVMRTHPIASERLIREVPGLDHLGPAVRAEHERWDGTGYPDGLAGEAIPLASRITLVCDAYHAMTSDRPYRKALPREVARAEIEKGIGTQFCPRAAGALLQVLDDQQQREDGVAPSG